MPRIVPASLVACGLFLGLAASVLPAPAAALQLTEIDSNRDGFISRGELVLAVSKRFSERDLNNDGMLSMVELTRNPTLRSNLSYAQAHAMMTEFDKDGDRLISAYELLGRIMSSAGFDLFDSNNDGHVSQGEARFRGLYLPVLP